MNQEILLLRDYSELSDEVEKYLKENDFDYLCFYPHKENSIDSLP
jgi:chlorite dismutase